MPHREELNAAWQTAMDKHIVSPIRTELILDPSGDNINISSYIDISDGLVIRKKKQINPHGSLGRYTMSEIKIKLLNHNNYFNHNDINSPFYHYTTRLFADASAADTYIDVPAGDAESTNLEAGMIITIKGGEGSISKTIVSIDTTSYTYYDRISFGASAIGDDFNAGALVEVAYRPGNTVTIKNTIDGEATKINQATMILASLPKLTSQYAEIYLTDYFYNLLENSLKANDYRIIDGDYGEHTNSLEYNRADDTNPSTGLFNIDQMVIYSDGCKIGQWTIRFLNDTGDYNLIDPDGIVYPEEITSLAAPFSGGKQQLLIGNVASGQFSSSDFVKNDEIKFKTVCSLGLPVNTYNTIPQMIYRLMIEDFGAELAASYLNLTSFNNLIDDYDEMIGGISFTEPTTVLKAIELLQQHINATLFINNDGEFYLSCYRPRQDPTTIYELSPDADIREIDQEDMGRIERIVALYNYDHDTGQYLNKIVLPIGATSIGNALEIKLPAFHRTAQALACASRIWQMWRRGVKIYNIKEKWNYGLAFDIDEVYQVSSEHPEFSDKIVQIYELNKNTISGELEIMAMDFHFLYGHYAFCDIDYCDRGKVTW